MTDPTSTGPQLRNPLAGTLRAGGLAGAPEVMRKMVRLGVRFVTAGSEWDFMLAAMRQRAGVLRQLPLEE